MEEKRFRNTALAILSVMGWFAVITQFVLMMQNTNETKAEAVIRFFSYFTIETNLLLALSFTTRWLFPRSTLAGFFSKPTVQTALTVYIFIVGFIYNTVLRFIWEPTGLQELVDELLHSVIPVTAIIYWLLYTPKETLYWKQCFNWLIYPLVYIGFVLLRGQQSGFYPYPFIDTRKLGINKVLANAIGIAFLFLLVALAFIFIARVIVRTQKQSQLPH